jgi:UbiD family decarboxylase
MASNIHPKDMRTWIAELEEAGELVRIDKPVDPLTQMGSLLYQSREKALFFENLPHGWRSLGQAPANTRHAHGQVHQTRDGQGWAGQGGQA